MLQAKLGATWQVAEHTLGFGVERQTYDIFNAFTQHTSKASSVFNSIADFQAGLPNQVFYGNGAVTNNPNDTAAFFDYTINTAVHSGRVPGRR